MLKSGDLVRVAPTGDLGLEPCSDLSLELWESCGPCSSPGYSCRARSFSSVLHRARGITVALVFFRVLESKACQHLWGQLRGWHLLWAGATPSRTQRALETMATY